MYCNRYLVAEPMEFDYLIDFQMNSLDNYGELHIRRQVLLVGNCQGHSQKWDGW